MGIPNDTSRCMYLSFCLAKENLENKAKAGHWETEKTKAKTLENTSQKTCFDVVSKVAWRMQFFGSNRFIGFYPINYEVHRNTLLWQFSNEIAAAFLLVVAKMR